MGLRELRQQASELVRRVEAGEEVTITVAGRPSARLVPVAPHTWREWDEVAELFDRVRAVSAFVDVGSERSGASQPLP